MSLDPINSGNDRFIDSQKSDTPSGLSSKRTLELLMDKQLQLMLTIQELRKQQEVSKPNEQVKIDNNKKHNELPGVEFARLKLEGINSLINKMLNKDTEA